MAYCHQPASVICGLLHLFKNYLAILYHIRYVVSVEKETENCRFEDPYHPHPKGTSFLDEK